MIKLIKPLHGKTIPMPEYNYAPLPLEGIELQLNSYWYARIDDGDVSIEQEILTEKKSKKESV
jgi:hypothetical protein